MALRFEDEDSVDFFMNNNPPVPEEMFFPAEPSPTPTVMQQPSSDQTIFLLLKILEEMNKNHAEDRKKIDVMEKRLESMKRQIDFLVGKKEEKLERCTEYRKRKKQKTLDFNS